jgi:hypothetical protein
MGFLFEEKNKKTNQNKPKKTKKKLCPKATNISLLCSRNVQYMRLPLLLAPISKSSSTISDIANAPRIFKISSLF